MVFYRHIFLYTVLNSFTPPCSTFNTKAIQLYEEAMHSYLQKQYPRAIELFEQACKQDKHFIEAYLQIATIYSDREEFEVAKQFLDLGRVSLSAAKAPELVYKLAQLYYKIGAYAQSSDVLHALFLGKLSSQALQQDVQILQQNLQFALEMLEHPFPFHPKRLASPMNQFIAQYFPILTVNQRSILFTALRATGIMAM